MFDQRHTGEQLEWRGLATLCDSGPEKVSTENLKQAIQRSLSNEARKETLEMAETLQKEDTLLHTVMMLVGKLQTSNRPNPSLQHF